jgi:hypothetical protein
MSQKSTSDETSAVIPAAWRQTIECKKTVIGWPEWSEVHVLSTGKHVRTPRDDVHTVSAETTEVLWQIADEQEIGLAGVRLRFKAWAYRRQRDVTATLEVVGARSFVTIARIDAWPSDPHINSLAVLKKNGLKMFPVKVEGCHVHRFTDNAKYGVGAFAPEGNLPVAVPFPNGLQSFRDFLRSVKTEFNIEGLDEFPSPPSWQVIL